MEELIYAINLLNLNKVKLLEIIFTHELQKLELPETMHKVITDDDGGDSVLGRGLDYSEAEIEVYRKRVVDMNETLNILHGNELSIKKLLALKPVK